MPSNTLIIAGMVCLLLFIIGIAIGAWTTSAPEGQAFDVQIYNGNVRAYEFTCATYRVSGDIYTFYNSKRQVMWEQTYNCTWGISISHMGDSDVAP
jgi:hypothetical protein